MSLVSLTREIGSVGLMHMRVILMHMRVIEASEAETHLSRPLDKVKGREKPATTRHHRPIAGIEPGVPPGDEGRRF